MIERTSARLRAAPSGRSARPTRFIALCGAFVAGLITALPATTPVAVAVAGSEAPRGLVPSVAADHGSGGRGMTRVVRTPLGDWLRVHRAADGSERIELLRKSPSFGKPFRIFRAQGRTYFLPLGAIAATAGAASASFFEVSALVDAADASDPAHVWIEHGDRRRVLGVDEVRPADLAGADAMGLVGSQLDQRVHAGYRLHTLTLRLRVPKGVKERAEIVVQNVDDTRSFLYSVLAVDGEARIAVPKGRYTVSAMRLVGRDARIAYVPEVAVRSDRSVDVSFTGRRIPVEVAVPGAQREMLTVRLKRAARVRGTNTVEATVDERRTLSVVVPRRSVRTGRLTTGVEATLWRGARTGNPVEIRTLAEYRALPSSLSRTYQRHDFARVRTTIHADGPAEQASLSTWGVRPDESVAIDFPREVAVPGVLRQWLLARHGIRWAHDLDRADGSYTRVDYRSYRPGAIERRDWLRGPLSAGFKTPSGPGRGRCEVCRDRSRLVLNIPLLADADGNGGSPAAAAWRLRQGDLTLASGDSSAGAIYAAAETRPGLNTFRIDAHGSRPGKARLSRDARSTWTFTSRRSDGPVNLLTGSYAPRVRRDGSTSTPRMSFPLRFDSRDPSAPRVTRVSFAVSFDNAKTWRPAEVRRTGARSFMISYPHGRAHGYVSLRLSARDADGFTHRERVVNVYRLGDSGEQSPHRASPKQPTSTGIGPERGERKACAHAQEREVRCFAVVNEPASARLSASRRGQQDGSPLRGMSTTRTEGSNRNSAVAGYNAEQIRAAYGIEPGATSTVGVVVAHHYPSAEADLGVYRAANGLIPCTSQNGCFRQIRLRDQQGKPARSDAGWSIEAALDLQMVSAACPECRIVLVEGTSPRLGALARATRVAASAGATVTNHSYGVQEFGAILRAAPAYAIPGSIAVAASGDSGYVPAIFPASLPQVIAVGGTSLTADRSSRGWHERAWIGSGSGCSAYFARPAHQTGPVCKSRTTADVSAVADPATGVAVFNSFALPEGQEWMVAGGTSAAAPIVAGMIGGAGSGSHLSTGHLVGNAHLFNDVRTGRNGHCRRTYICQAGPGYDAPTGLGTPQGATSFAVAPNKGPGFGSISGAR